MLNLNYDNRHTFLISSGIILLLFGLGIIYITPSINDLSIKSWAFVVGSVVIGVVLLKKGLNIWNERDEDEKTIREFKKKEMERSNELITIEISIKGCELEKIKNSQELTELANKIAQAKEQKKAIDQSLNKEMDELNNIQKEIIKNEKELVNKKRQLFQERNSDIEALPSSSVNFSIYGINSLMTPTSAYVINDTGVVFSAGHIDLKNLNTTGYISPQFLNQRTCKSCKNLYVIDMNAPIVDMGICKNCSPGTYFT